MDFRYVAMHAMQDDLGSHDHTQGHGHGYHSVSHNGYGDMNYPTQLKRQGLQMRDTLATLGGMLLPLLLAQLGLGHGH
jgi:zinc transporter 9